MFPTKTVKEEISNENIETNELNNKEIKIEVKMEEVDPIAVTSFDNDPLHLDNVKMETNEIDYEAFYVKVKDEFDSEIVEQELENNDEIINKPVMIGDPEVEPSSSSKKLILLPKAVFLDMKAKTKSEVETADLPGSSKKTSDAAGKAVPSNVPCPSNVTKNRRGKLISSEQRKKAYDIYLTYKNTGLSKSRSVALTFADMGISEKTVWAIVVDMETTGEIRSPSKKRKRKRLFHKLDDKQKETLRQIVQSFISKNERPTLDKISQEMKTLLSQFLEEREALLLKNAELRNEMGLLKNKNSRHRRNIQILNQKVALFENRAKSSDTRLKEANLVNKQLQSKVDELQTHICLLSTSNSKLKGDLERRLRGKDKLKLLTTRPEVESNNDKMFTENREPTEKDLKDTVISLVKENNIVKRQLNTKIEELKKTQEKYGQTMMALSKERRKTEELMQNAPPKKKKIETLVEKVRR